MKEYVCGFLFDKAKSSVLLIEKQTPPWQKGKYNGIGGKIEIGESPEQAMQREFREEAGLDIEEWSKLAILEGTEEDQSGWRVYFFIAEGDTSAGHSVTIEQVKEVRVEDITSYPILPNLRWLIPLAVDRYAQNGTTKITLCD